MNQAWVAWVAAALVLAAPAPAAAGAGQDTVEIDCPAAQPRPEYLALSADPVLGAFVTRIANDSGKTTAPVQGTWGGDARHVYSKQQPWSSDNALLVIENRNGGSPSPLFLDGATYAPRLGPCEANVLYDYRWHPSPLHPTEMINVDQSGTELCWFDVSTCARTRSWSLPVAVTGFGSGDGNPSNDGRFIALGNDSAMFVVDMDPQPPLAPYPNLRIGPLYPFPPCSLGTGSSRCTLTGVSVSASGRFVVVKYKGVDDTTSDDLRVFEVDPATLELQPHAMAEASLRCGSFAGRPNGWIYPLKHPDLALDPFDDDEDVLVGGRSCPGSTLGRVLKVRLRDGAVTALTDPENEPSVSHVSTRNIDRPGWAYVSYYRDGCRRFNGEIVAVRLDGSRTVERFIHYHGAAADCYRCEAHPVPSRDGKRVLFASNWAEDCAAGCGALTDIKDYVAWIPATMPPVRRHLAVEGILPSPAAGLPSVVYSLENWAPATLELVDLTGRRVLRRDLGAPGPGRHVASLERAPAPTPTSGVYWIRVSQAGRRVSATTVIVR